VVADVRELRGLAERGPVVPEHAAAGELVAFAFFGCSGL
jgi:hypothetical protein